MVYSFTDINYGGAFFYSGGLSRFYGMLFKRKKSHYFERNQIKLVYDIMRMNYELRMIVFVVFE